MRKTKQEGVSKFSPISQYLRANGWTKEADSFDAVNEAAARIATLEAERDKARSDAKEPTDA